MGIEAAHAIKIGIARLSGNVTRCVKIRAIVTPWIAALRVTKSGLWAAAAVARIAQIDKNARPAPIDPMGWRSRVSSAEALGLTLALNRAPNVGRHNSAPNVAMGAIAARSGPWSARPGLRSRQCRSVPIVRLLNKTVSRQARCQRKGCGCPK
jgi:hypothetical protein